MSENILFLKGVNKSFGSNQVLFDVDFSLKSGEIHGIIGENGAGKSTLMNITYGLVHPESGDIFIEGAKTEIKNAYQAQKQGVCFVHQEIALCPELTVAENIFMSRINQMRTLNINYNALNKEAEALLAPLSSDIRGTDIVANLTISNQQVVEIAKALSTKCKILILDEPTASLSDAEAEALWIIMKKLKSDGIGIIYISHRLSEIFEQCDRVSVLRDGRMINTYAVNAVDTNQLINDMAGREINNIYPEKSTMEKDTVLLEVKGLTDALGRFEDVSFTLKRGEILGFSGLIGSGRSEVMQAIVGLRKAKSGAVQYKGRDIFHKPTRQIFDDGLVYLSEDRKLSGLFLDMSCKENVSALHLKTIQNGGLISDTLERTQAQQLIEKLRVKCRSASQIVRSLSGGNQQKILISKLLVITPDIIIMDEPTRGIDVGAKAEIHHLLRELCNTGVGVILVSSELNEVIGLSDRVLVMHEGRLCTEVIDDEINSTSIMFYASGAYQMAEEVSVPSN